MYARQTTNEDIALAREISRIIRKSENSKREKKLQKIKQKLLGVVMIIVSIITPFLLEGDATFSIFILPLGLYILCTKQNIFEYEVD